MYVLYVPFSSKQERGRDTLYLNEQGHFCTSNIISNQNKTCSNLYLIINVSLLFSSQQRIYYKRCPLICNHDSTF